MGNKCCDPILKFGKDFTVPDLKIKSQYGNTEQYVDQDMVKSIFNQSYQQYRQSKLLKKISDNASKVFIDQQFQLQIEEEQRLSILFNFKKMNAQVYNSTEGTDNLSFMQQHVQFTYLTSVFYFLCRENIRKTVMPRIIQTSNTNTYGVYSLHFYNNGEPHTVIIDDRVPINHNDSLIYLQIVKGRQLWPLILQKAWCKQIGSYELAKGLSPEDAFEEITGIPSYTYNIRTNSYEFIKQKLENSVELGYWVTLVGRKDTTDIMSRQVFFLQWIIPVTQEYIIISPYNKFQFISNSNNSCRNHTNYYKQLRPGEIRIKIQDIYTHFDYVIIGFHKDDYLLQSIKVSSKAQEEMLFELRVLYKQEISIRFNQLYKAYLNKQERNNYAYSPVIIELYKYVQEQGINRYDLITNIQGYNRSIAGVRSSQCWDSFVFKQLEGYHILRLLVDWQHENTIHEGNLVLYSKKDASLKSIPNNGQMYNEIYPSFFQLSFNQVIIIGQKYLQINTYNKRYTTLIGFRNLQDVKIKIRVNFEKSSNITITGNCQISNKICIMLIEPNQLIILEIFPFPFNSQMILEDFDIDIISQK